MVYDVRCKFCGRESMDYSPGGDTETNAMVQCMACGLESSYDDAKHAYAEAHWKHSGHTKGWNDPLSPTNLEAWKLKRPK